MFHKKAGKKVTFSILFVFLVVAIAGVWFILDFISIGPGLPPSESMPNWYIPGARQENEKGCASYFPEISPNCNSGNFSGEKLIIVWYFDDESKFSKGKDTLYHYLEERSNVSQQELNIRTGIQEEIKVIETINFNATRYESPETSGYFLVYERPFLETREDYFIVYYGIRGMTNLTEETPALEELIAKSYYMGNEKGKVDSLKIEVS